MMKLISHDNMHLRAGRAFLFLCLVMLAAKASAESITLQEWVDWRKDDKVIAKIEGRFDIVITGVKNLEQVGKREGEGRLETPFDVDYPGEYYTSHEINRYYEATVPKNSTVNIDVKVTHSGDIGKSEAAGHHLKIYDERAHFQESNKYIEVPGTPTNISASTSYHMTSCDDYTIRIDSYDYGEVSTGMHIHHPFTGPSFHVYIKLHVTNEEPLAEEPPQTIEEASTSPHVVEESDAWDFGGAWPFLIPASVIAAIGGYALTRRRRKGDSDSDDDEPQDDAPCELHIYKAFGNTLLVGDEPQQVFAKVVRTDPTTGVRTDPALTAMISIYSGDGYLEVQDGGMYGEWRTAWVMAPERPNAPEDGVVTFTMGNETGSYTNRLHFRIANGEVLFGQDNLTMPALYKKQVELPFVVVGIDPLNDPVEAEITYGGKRTKDYSVKVEWREKEQMHYALINDLVQDEKANPGVPGKHINYKLEVTSRRSNGLEIKGELPLLRFYMGLQVKVKDVKCFIEEYEPLNHKQSRIGVRSKDKFYVPAETRLCMTLYEYDDEKNQLLKLYPIPYYDEKTKEVGFKVTASDPAKQDMVNKLGMQIQPTKAIDPKEGRVCFLRCCNNMLAAPNRLGGTVSIKVKHEDREYETRVAVRLCSQPVREFADNRAWAAAQNEDDRITKRLDHIASEIYRHGMVNNLFPLLKYIDLLRTSFDEDEERVFGYDKKSIQTVVQTYNDVYSGRKAGANEDPGPPITFADDMRMFIMSWFNAARTVQQNLGFFGNMFVGIFAPWVTTAFTVVEILGDMRDYVERGGDSVMEGWFVGAKVVLRDALFGEIAKRGFAKAHKMGFTKETMNQAFQEMSGFDVADFWSKSKLSYLTKEIHLFKQSTAQAKFEADELLKKAKADGKNKLDLDEATKFGKARAKQNVHDLRAVCELYRSNPTPENLKLRDQMIMKCQADKQSMYLLKQKGETFNLTRKDFNGHLEDLYARTDAAVETELSRRLGGKKVRHKNMSSKTRTDLAEGKTVTLDRDSTYQYMDSDGTWKTIDNQELVEQIYKEKFYTESTGGFKAETADAPTSLKEKIESRYAQKMDQTIIQKELTHPESYGPDVKKMLGKQHGEALDDALQVSKAVEFKGKERFERGRQMLADAKNITDPLERVAKEADAIGELMEGCRQEVKIYDQFTVPRDFARANVNGGSQISPKLKKAIEQFRKFESGGCKLEDLETALEPLGYTLDSVAEEMGKAMLKIG